MEQMKTTIRIGLLAAALAISGCSSDSPSAPTPSGPPATLTQVQPAAASVGDPLTITGTGFAAMGNSVKIGAGYLHNIPSDDTKTLAFVLRANLGACPPTVSVCTQQALPLTAGIYKLAVVNANGTSNELSFEVTASK
jgi:hypothetical protein